MQLIWNWWIQYKYNYNILCLSIKVLSKQNFYLRLVTNKFQKLTNCFLKKNYKIIKYLNNIA